MRGTWVAIFGVAAFLAFAAGAGWLPLGAGISCTVDEAIDAPVRNGAYAASTKFFDQLLKRETDGAYALLAADSAKATPREAFDAAIGQILDSAGGAFRDLKAEHAYHVTRANTAGRVLCGNSITGVAVNALADVTQVHTVYTAVTDSHAWALTAWMVQDGDGRTWRVQSFNITVSGVAGRSAEDLEKLAQAQAAKGHQFNAFLLMSAASATAYRGADLQLASKPKIDAALAEIPAPSEMTGGPPRKWRLGGKLYQIEQTTIVGAGEQLGLVITYRDPMWDETNDADGEVRNRALIDAFVLAHRDWNEAFGFIVARILRPDSQQGWGTVFDAAGGYSPDAEKAAPEAAPVEDVAADPGDTVIPPPPENGGGN